MNTEISNISNKPLTFGAIKVPVSAYSDKINYGVITNLIEKYAPKDKIQIRRGLINNAEFDYIMTKSNSIKEKNILRELSKLSNAVLPVDARKIKSATNSYDKFMKTFDSKEFNVLGDVFSDSHDEFVKTLRKHISLDAISENNIDFNNSLGNRTKSVEELLKKSTVVDGKLYKLDLYNFAKVQENCYKGQSLFNATKTSTVENNFKMIKDAGIKTIIDYQASPLLVEFRKEDCIGLGLEYFDFPMENLFSKNVFTKHLEHSTSEDTQFIEKFKSFINLKQKGYTYEGCMFGDERTDEALLLSNYFNPKDKQIKDIESSSFIKEALKGYKISMKNLYLNLSEKDKLDMGYTPEFDANLKRRLGIE